ncbi:hypothetical protein GOBAR_DD10829 [Gossypium barbadense]|nr:hypothetical protein GOBAR_DD10829 [Gossypium barbadense]
MVLCEGVVPGGGVAQLGGVALARRCYTSAGATRARGKPGSVAAAGVVMLGFLGYTAISYIASGCLHGPIREGVVTGKGLAWRANGTGALAFPRDAPQCSSCPSSSFSAPMASKQRSSPTAPRR